MVIWYLQSEIKTFYKKQFLFDMEEAVVSFVLFMNPSYIGD